jgi:hypothetical protein
VDALDPDKADALAAVAHTAFTAFKQKGIGALVIDVRENGGGDDPLWQQSLMEYITAKPYAQLSHYEMRVTKKDADSGDVIGDVQRADYTKRFMPRPVEPLRFDGPVTILAGRFEIGMRACTRSSSRATRSTRTPAGRDRFLYVGGFLARRFPSSIERRPARGPATLRIFAVANT